MSIFNWKQLSRSWRRIYRQHCSKYGKHSPPNRSSSASSSTSTKSKITLKLPDLSPRLRLMFIIVAFIFLAFASAIFMLTILTPNTTDENKISNNGAAVVVHGKMINSHKKNNRDESKLLSIWRLRSMLQNHRTTFLFLSTTFAFFQLMAILAAIFNWSIVLFSYVIITGIFGTIIGIVGIVGIIFTVILMRNDHNHNDHTITITIAIVITFVCVFYLMTILGLRLIDYFRYRRKHLTNTNKSICNLRGYYHNNKDDGQGHANNNQNQNCYGQTSLLSIGDRLELCDQIKNIHINNNDVDFKIRINDDNDLNYDTDDDNDNYDDYHSNYDQQNQMTQISLLSLDNN